MQDASPPEPDPAQTRPRGPGLWNVFRSVLASFLGVQSRRRHDADFSAADRNPWPYILVGLVMTLLFILGVVMVVRLVLRSAGV